MRLPARVLLCATDFSAVGDAAVPLAYELAEDGATVHLMHVVEPPVPLAALGSPVYPIPVMPEDREALEREARRHLDALTSREAAGRGIRTEVHVFHEIGAANVIDREARRLGVDLVVVGTHGRGGLSRLVLGSVASALLRHVSAPLVLYRPTPAGAR